MKKKTYTAHFRNDGECAMESFEAKTPRQALAKARKFLKTRWDELHFESYDGGSAVDEIEICTDEEDELAVWRDDDLRLRLAARDLLDALELCEDVLSEFARLDDGTPSISALHAARDAIAKAKGGEK